MTGGTDLPDGDVGALAKDLHEARLVLGGLHVPEAGIRAALHCPETRTQPSIQPCKQAIKKPKNEVPPYHNCSVQTSTDLS